MSKLKDAMTAGAAGTRELSPYERFRGQLNLVRVCLNAVQANQKLLDAKTDRRSLLLACMKAAQDGLLPDGREAVFNIYGTKDREKSRAAGHDVWVDLVQYLPMAYGLIQKIYEAGASYVDAVPVYAADKFEYARGDEPRIVHVPYDGDEDPGKVKAAYVIVKLKTGETKREVMFFRDIERARKKSKSPDGLMWKEFYDQGAVKTVIHRIVKQLPRSEALDRTLAHDDEAVGLADIPVAATGADLEALVDMRVPAKTEPAQPQQAAAAPQAAGSTTTNEAEPKEKADSKEAPKPGDPGTPEMKARYLAAFEASTDIEVLGIKMDETKFYKWSDEDAAEIKGAYDLKLATLENPPPPVEKTKSKK